MSFKAIGEKCEGYLVPIEDIQILFNIRRVYYVYNTPKDIARGFHAHKELEQILICINGSVVINCEDVEGRKEQYILNNPALGLYIGRMIWHTMEQFSDGAILLVLASDLYNEEDYIRDYVEFKNRCNRGE